jgi:4-azaleucine resistance transporter AzlC
VNVPQPTRRAEFLAGMRDTLPLELGAIPFGIIFGAVAVTNGLSPAAAIAFSALVFAGSAQFIAAGMVAGGAATPVIILTTFVVNLRHALYAATLAPHMRHLPQRWLIPLGFWLTDESFVVVARRYEQRDPSAYKHYYFLGSAVLMYVNWQVWTWVGVLAGQRIPDPAGWGLDFALIVTFTGMLVPMIRSRATLVAVLAAAIVAVLANGLPNKLGLILAALAGVAAGVAAQTVWHEPARPPEVTDAGA